MIRCLPFPRLLETGPICGGLSAVRDLFVNLYVVQTATGFICVDTGWSRGRVIRGFHRLGLNAQDASAVFLTHLHWDHARCRTLFTRARIFCGDSRRPVSRCEPLGDGQVLTMAGLTVRVIATPGHTSESASYLIDERFLFTGDTVWLRSGEVFPFMPWLSRDRREQDRSIRKLARIAGEGRLLTAHSGASSSTGTALARWREAGDA